MSDPKKKQVRNLQAESDSLTHVYNRMKNPWVQRWVNDDPRNIPDPLEPNSGRTSTHLLSYDTNKDGRARIYPLVVDNPKTGKLRYLNNEAAIEHAKRNKSFMYADSTLADYYTKQGMKDYGKQDSIVDTPSYAYGSYLPKHGFGSWLKDNSAGLLKGASSLANFLPPPISTIAGPVLSIAGGVASGMQANKKAQTEADLQAEETAKEQAMLDEQAQTQMDANYQSDLGNRRGSFLNANKSINYGGLAEDGGQLQDPFSTPVGDPMVIEYSDKAFKHGEGPDGVPVDAKGNPSATSNQSAVALTEGGEVTWNGYVFSNKLKYNGNKK